MARAVGANAIMALSFEDSYGVPKASGANVYTRMPFVSSELGEEQNLVASDLLGQGREPLAPSLDVINNTGTVTVPVDVRFFGLWLKLVFGPPTTSAFAAAEGALVFASQPDAASVVTVNGTGFSAVASAPTGNQYLIGASLSETMTNLATVLNASVVTGVAKATYVATSNSITMTVDLLGPTGNAFTLAADAGSHATPSGATLTGGANQHVFTSGATSLPSASIEIGNPEIPSFRMNYGVRANNLKISMSRSGLLNAQIDLIAQGEAAATTSQCGTLKTMLFERFTQFTGGLTRNSAPLSSIVSTDFTYTNDLDTVEVIRTDGRIEDADPGTVGFTGSIVTRWKDGMLDDQAIAQEACDMGFGWTRSAAQSLDFNTPGLFLPRAKKPVTGPKGIQGTYPFQCSIGPDGYTVSATLVNDVASYA